MSLKDKWAKKKSFKTEEFVYLGETVKIREMSGFENIRMSEIEDMVDKSFFIWDNCVLSESLKLTKDEFAHAFDKSHAEVDYIVMKILTASSGKEKN